MSFKLEIFIAFRYFRSRRNESFISLSSLFSFLGITIGVATLIIVMSVMNGFRTELIDKIVGINGHIIVYFNNKSANDNQLIYNKIETSQNIEVVSKEIELHSMISSENNSSGILIKGIELVDLYERSSIASNITKGSISNFQRNTIVVGSRLASFLNIDVNEKVSLITASKTKTPFGSIPNMSSFKVVAIFDVGMYNYDRNIAFIPRDTSLSLLNKKEDYISQLEIFLEDKKKITETVNTISQIVNDNGAIYTWESMHKELFNALQVEKKVMFLILSLIIFVAAFNLISSIIMIVKDKERGIGILRSIGFNRGQILRIFIIIGSIVGVLGTIIGTMIGIIITLNIASIQLFLEDLFGSSLFAPEIYFFNLIPSKIDITEVIFIILIALILSFFSTIYPAWKASRIEPANIMRYE